MSGLPLTLLSIVCALALPGISRSADAISSTGVQHWPTEENVCVDAPLRLAFSTPVSLGEQGKIEVCRKADGQPVETIELGQSENTDSFGSIGGRLLRYEPILIDGKTVSIRLHSHRLAYGESYFVRVSGGVIRDAQGNDLGAQIGDWEFRTRSTPPGDPRHLTVSGDGSADFCTVQGAVDQAESSTEHPATIFIRKGIYREIVRIGSDKRHLKLVGEDRKGTVISYTNNDKLNRGTSQRAVLGIEADDCSLENLTVQNTTPYRGSQAEAIYVKAERCILHNADFLSFQDTLSLNGRVYVADCYIEGDVDYVWGYGSALLERCELRTLHDGYLVQARNADAAGGYVFLDCKLTAVPEVKKCWLARIETGRFPTSHVAFVHCAMGPHIPPRGWEITGPSPATVRFQEFESVDLAGKPLDVSERAPESKQIKANEAQALARILAGSDGWNPCSSFPHSTAAQPAAAAANP